MSTPVRFTALTAALLAACSQSPKAPPAPPSDASVVFARASATETRLFAQPESGGEAIALTPAGSRAEFGGTAGKRVIYGVLAADGTLASVRSVGLDGQGDVALGALTPAAYRGLRGLHVASDGSLLIELAQAAGARELRIARGGSAPLATFAAGSWLGEAAGAVVYLANAQSLGDGVGDVRALRLDGSGDRLLGAGGGDDQFHGLSGSSALVTARRSGAAEVRSVPLDGAAAKVRAGSRGVLFSRGVLVAARGASLEKLDAALSATTLALPSGATALAVLPDGRVAGFLAGSGLLAADAAKATVLDTPAASSALAAHVLASGDRLVYTANGDTGSFLRSARLDGTGAALLSEGHGQTVLFTSEMGSGRVVFYKTKGNEPGGWLHSVRAEGGDERMLGDSASGTLAAADHDFGGVTKAGRIIFEAELVEHQAPRLFVVEPDGTLRGLTGAGSYATLSAIVE